MDGDFATDTISGQKVEPSTPAMHRVVLSIAQDIIYRTTSGRVKPPKHVCLPMAIRHLTGSTQLITMINRFGHGAAASQLQEMEVHLAEEHLRAQSNHDVFLPESLREGFFTTFCWDNNDICE